MKHTLKVLLFSVMMACVVVVSSCSNGSRQETMSQDTARLVHGLFTPVEQQIALVRARNVERGWGFMEPDFEELAAPPTWPKDRLTAVVLVPYLGDQGEVKGVQRTFDELWIWAASRQEDSWRWDGLKSDPEHLRLLSGIEHKPGLRWEVIDLWGHLDSSPVEVRKSDESPHAGVIAAAALHPNWIAGNFVLYVWIPGYEVNVPFHVPWRYVPYVYFSRDGRRVGLYARDCGNAYSGWAVPRFKKGE